ncbi:MAG: efflux RND transporter permease subunit [bacterium]
MSTSEETGATAPKRDKPPSLIDKVIRFSLEQKLIVFLVLLMITGWGIMVAPFDWNIQGLTRDPVPVDAIPDIGENQQIVFTKWPGRSPQDVEDQIGYPLTTQLLGIPGIKTIRSYSMFGFSTIYVIFKEKVEFYWSRTRVLEKLNSLPSGTLPAGVRPMLGPDATALGQVFWYTLEGREKTGPPAWAVGRPSVLFFWEVLEGHDKLGKPAGGWDLQELRSAQDWYVRYALMGAEGVAEVASIGGFVKEYQIDVDPDAMRAHRVTLHHIVQAIKQTNRDVGARTIEVNKVEYVIRGIGFIKSVSDIEHAVIRVENNVPIYVKDVAKVAMGPSTRRGALDKEGAEAVGGVVVARFGANPLEVIKNLKKKIREIAPGLPKKTLADGTVSQVTVVPFYDRSGLIKETLNTLKIALTDEILVTIIVVLIMLMHLKSSLLISGLLPVAVLMTFIAMKVFGVDANVVALSGIAIAIGTMVDMGIVVTENIVESLERAPPGANRREVIYEATSEVGSAVLTAVSTTVVSFLPVFAMEAAEGKLFKPLAFTKTFALIASVIVALTLIPPIAHLLFTDRRRSEVYRYIVYGGLIGVGVLAAVLLPWWWVGGLIIMMGVWSLIKTWVPERARVWVVRGANGLAVLIVTLLLASHWMPLGPEKGPVRNVALVVILLGGLLLFLQLFLKGYPYILRWCLEHKLAFLSIPAFVLVFGALAWLGFNTVFGWLPKSVKNTGLVSRIAKKFPGLGKEFMPPLDEGSFLLMPTTMPHASIGEAMDIMRKMDMAISAIPEVELAVGKLGRAESPLDPAPISMIETIINYKPEYILNDAGRRRTFKYEPDTVDYFRDASGKQVPAPDGKPYKARGRFPRDKHGKLIPDEDGQPFRNWRPALSPKLNPGRKAWPGINKPKDIWARIVRAAKVPGATSAPHLQPIAARIVMLQSGMRAAMGVKIRGPDLRTIEQVGMQIERLLKQVDVIEPTSVVADRIVGKPYLEIHIDRQAIARYGIQLDAVQQVIEMAIGGMAITTTVEGRERYPVRVRYLRELRDTIESLGGIMVAAPGGAQIPIRQLARITFVRGPQVIKSEDTFLTGYVTFDKKEGVAEVDAVEQAQAYLEKMKKSGELKIPNGVSYVFAGAYENQVRSEKRLMIVLPVALAVIFLILYLQFRTTWATGLVFSGILVAWSGGFIMIWLYHQPWFLDFAMFGRNLRDLFQVHPINLSVAIWVGFLALFGIATDDGVIMGTYLKDRFAKTPPTSVAEVREATLDAGMKRVRPCLMTAGTTLLALLPVLTSSGRGADIMVPMAIPSFGGMLIQIMTMLIVPVLYSAVQEFHFKNKLGQFRQPEGAPPDQSAAVPRD